MNFQLQRIPFLRLLLPFLGGVVVQEKIRTDEKIILFLLILFSALLFFSLILKFSDNYRWNIIFGILLYGILGLTGMNLREITVPAFRPEDFRLGRIILIPEEKEKTYKILLGKIKEKKSGEWHAIDGKVLVYIDKTSVISSLEPGDLLVFHSSLQVIEGPANPMEFDFRKYCESFGISWKTYLRNGQWKKLNKEVNLFSLYGAEWIRMKLVGYLQGKNLRYESLISSLVLGYREGLSDAQQQYFAASGAMHILAVSGLHVGIIYGALVFIISGFFRKKNGYILLLPLPVIWAYAMITGMTPSVARSAIMISLYVISRFLNRQTETLNIILFSGFFMILAKPSVIHQVSFLLSYAAVIGISAVFQGLYGKMKTGNWFLNQIISITCMSIAAQLFTFPLSIYYFHQFPNYFLITNIFAVPLSGIILIAGFIFLAFSFSMPISSILAVILDKLTGILDILTKIIGTLPFSSTAKISIDVFEVIMIYITIFCLVGYFHTKRINNLYFAFISVILICGNNFRDKIRQSANKEIIVLSVQGTTAINLITGPLNLVLTDDTSLVSRSRISFQSVNYWYSLGLDEPEFIQLPGENNRNFEEKGLFLSGSDNDSIIFFQFSDARIGILKECPGCKRQAETPINLDLLIIKSKYPFKTGELTDIIKPGVVVIDRDVPSWVAEKIGNECLQYGIPYHNIYRSGYFKLEL
jgi:competence protein ComEC